MDPLTGFVLTIIMVVVCGTVNLIAWPFRMAKEVAATHPRRTARMVLGAIAGGVFAYAFNLPYVIEVTFGGGLVGLIIGEVIS